MLTFTKEQLIASTHARIEFAEMMLAGELEPLKERTWSIELELARIALASLEAEAVGEVVLGEYDDCGCHPDAKVVCIAADGQVDWENFKDGTHLYTSPPVPVSVPDLTALDGLAGEMLNHAMNCERRVAVAYTHCAHRLAEEVRDLRAAMLHGAENAETPTTMQTAPALDSSPKIAGSPSGNAPVISDGWVACSERMPEQFVEVLVCTKDGSRYVAALNQRMNWDDGDFFDDIQDVTHWQPLPSSPAK